LTSETLNPPRGVRDIIGSEAELYEYLFTEFRRIARLNGFKPVIPPTIEHYKLFEAKSGEEIKKSMYVFEDKAGRLLALRPEITASIVRIYLKHLRGEVKPIRLYYIAQCFRYEEPQHARYREFWQAGLEVIGDPDVNGDVAAALTASAFLDKIGLEHYYVVGNVAFHRIILANAGLNPDDQDHVLHLIDKEYLSEALEYLKQVNAPETHIEAFNKLISTPLDKLEDFANQFKDLLGKDLDRFLEEKKRVTVFIEVLEKLGYRAEYTPLLVRGLAYYTGLIYEYKTKQLNVSIGGGGRYDNLTVVYGGPPEYSTGLALGIDRVALALGSKISMVSAEKREVVVVAVPNIPLDYLYRIQRTLASSNIASWVIRINKISKGLSIVSRKEIPVTVIIGEREFREQTATVKNMKTGEQVTVELNKLVEVVESFFEQKQ